MTIDLNWEQVVSAVPKKRIPKGDLEESCVVQHLKKIRLTVFRVGSGPGTCLTRKRSERVGTLVAIKGQDGKVRIGWSKCWLRKDGEPLDKFDARFGRHLASARALKQSSDELPHSLVEPLRQFIERVRKYYGEDTPIICKVKLPKGKKPLLPKKKKAKK